MTIRLRPHHLLCMLTFVGKGYTETFTRNYVAIAARLSGGEDIAVVDGPDDICQPMLAEPSCHCRNDSVRDRDGLAAASVSEILNMPIEAGSIIRPDAAVLARMRAAFATGVLRPACRGCEWADLCSQVAASGFDAVLVKS